MFGFLGVFVLTQMHGLGWSMRPRVIIAAVYLAAVVGVYATRSITAIHEVIRIPAIEYALVFAVALMVWVIMMLIMAIRPRLTRRRGGSSDVAERDESTDPDATARSRPGAEVSHRD